MHRWRKRLLSGEIHLDTSGKNLFKKSIDNGSMTMYNIGDDKGKVIRQWYYEKTY